MQDEIDICYQYSNEIYYKMKKYDNKLFYEITLYGENNYSHLLINKIRHNFLTYLTINNKLLSKIKKYIKTSIFGNIYGTNLLETTNPFTNKILDDIKDSNYNDASKEFKNYYLYDQVNNFINDFFYDNSNDDKICSYHKKLFMIFVRKCRNDDIKRFSNIIFEIYGDIFWLKYDDKDYELIKILNVIKIFMANIINEFRKLLTKIKPFNNKRKIIFGYDKVENEIIPLKINIIDNFFSKYYIYKLEISCENNNRKELTKKHKIGNIDFLFTKFYPSTNIIDLIINTFSIKKSAKKIDRNIFESLIDNNNLYIDTMDYYGYNDYKKKCLGKQLCNIIQKCNECNVGDYKKCLGKKVCGVVKKCNNCNIRNYLKILNNYDGEIKFNYPFCFEPVAIFLSKNKHLIIGYVGNIIGNINVYKIENNKSYSEQIYYVIMHMFDIFSKITSYEFLNNLFYILIVLYASDKKYIGLQKLINLTNYPEMSLSSYIIYNYELDNYLFKIIKLQLPDNIMAYNYLNILWNEYHIYKDNYNNFRYIVEEFIMIYGSEKDVLTKMDPWFIIKIIEGINDIEYQNLIEKYINKCGRDLICNSLDRSENEKEFRNKIIKLANYGITKNFLNGYYDKNPNYYKIINKKLIDDNNN